MSMPMPAQGISRPKTGRLLRLCLVLPVLGCSPAPKPLTVSQPTLPPPTSTGTIAAIRPESSLQDPTGALRQAMSILGYPAPPAVDMSEIVIRLPGDTIKTSVQPLPARLAVGSRAMITAAAPDVLIQPY